MQRLLLFLYPLLTFPILMDSPNFSRYSIMLMLWPVCCAFLIVTVSSRILKESIVQVSVNGETLIVLPLDSTTYINLSAGEELFQ
jgi:hypothetical protein